MRIEETIISNLFQNDEFTRKVTPFIKGEYFAERSERIIFEEFEKLFLQYNQVPNLYGFIGICLIVIGVFMVNYLGQAN